MSIIKSAKNLTKIFDGIKPNQKLFILYFIILFYFINISKEDTSISRIILTINGTGNQKILYGGSGCYPYNIDIPNKIFVNNISQNETGKIVCMFRDLSNITYIDLSNFDSSKVTMMNYMFYGCTSLKSLSLSNFITSQVNTMKYMFYKCSSLISLNLSNFDTSSS